eukprot:c10124_g1_i5.p1 GENE.c10124_g1_i5~~c10124_g1_i5.p1  ORF type:complete len:422 (-),score=149.83 c10124_g1_i5:326-1450(-)
MNAISMAAEMAVNTLSHTPHSHPQKAEKESLLEMMENIVKATDLAVVVLNDVLDMQKLQSGSFQFTRRPFQLIEAHQQVFRVMQYQLSQKHIQFSLNVDESLGNLIVVGDSNRFKQVLQNILSNACKFSPYDSQIDVSVSNLRQSTDSVRIRTSVADRGKGIDESERHKVFRPWGQLQAGEQLGIGSGLGLALSKDFVEKGFGGVLDFSSTPNGTTFYFEIDFPLVEDQSISDERANNSNSSLQELLPVRLENELNSMRLPECETVIHVDVVVVDDGAMNRILLVRMLQSLGVTCETYENGKQAFDDLTGANGRFVRCRLVLMDKEMPVMDGYAATQALRQNHFFRGHIIGITGNALDSQVCHFSFRFTECSLF